MDEIHIHNTQPYYMDLSFEQKLLFNAAVIQRKSLFFSGSAGTGKSHLLRAIIMGLSKKESESNNVVITAPTGTAAVNISGCTIQSFAGFLDESLTEKKFSEVLIKVQRIKQTRERWKSTSVLIIDECSMLQGTYFDCLEYIARNIRTSSSNRSFFGGIQVILCGDFLQIPPVVKTNTPLVWLFESKAFQSIPLKASLTHCFRQSEQRFINLLNETRAGSVSPETDSLLRKLLVKEEDLNKEHDRIRDQLYMKYSMDIRKLKLELQKVNQERQIALQNLSEMGGSSNFRHHLLDFLRVNRRCCELRTQKIRTTYVSPTFPVRLYAYRREVDECNDDSLRKEKNVIFRLQAKDENLPEKQYDPPSVISISIGAQVIITKNIDVQRGLCNGRQCVVKDIFYFQHKDGYGSKRCSASETHQSNLNATHGNTIDEVVVNVVTRSVVVEVQIGDKIQQIHPFTYEIKRGNGHVIGKRTQIPLGLAYALSIHKCQGMTLDTAIINIANAFSPGQAYVALSRLRSISGIKLTGYTMSSIKADQKALAFHKDLLNLCMSDPTALQANGFWLAGKELCKWKSDSKHEHHKCGYELLPQYTSLDEAFSNTTVSATKVPSLSKPHCLSSLLQNQDLPPPFSLKRSASTSDGATQSSLFVSVFSLMDTTTNKTSSSAQEPTEIGIVDLTSSQESSRNDTVPENEPKSRTPESKAGEEPPAKQVFTMEMFLPHLHKLTEMEEGKQLKMQPQSTEIFLQKQRQLLSITHVKSKNPDTYFSEATPFKPADTLLYK